MRAAQRDAAPRFMGCAQSKTATARRGDVRLVDDDDATTTTTEVRVKLVLLGASFERARYWAEELRKHGDARCRVLLVGNKIDAVRDDERATAREACEALAREYGMAAYRETSAKTGEGVQEAFEDVARAVMTREMSAREDATVVDA